MKNIKRPNLNELSLMTNAEKDVLITHLFDRLDILENKIEPNSTLQRIETDEEADDRRKFRRMKIPAVNSSVCEIMLSVPKEDASEEYKRNYSMAIDKAKRNSDRYHHNTTQVNLIPFRLHDISMAGCSMSNHDEEFSYFLEPHKVYGNCKIITPNQEEITVTFEIMSKRRTESGENHKFNELIGLKFIDIKHLKHAKN
jgi:hypothetical protein